MKVLLGIVGCLVTILLIMHDSFLWGVLLVTSYVLWWFERIVHKYPESVIPWVVFGATAIAVTAHLCL